MPRPFESEEFLDNQNWRHKSKSKLLEPSKCISSWTDICGFGSLLNKNSWDLNELQKNGFVHLLNEFHSIAGNPLLLGIDPFPNDKVIVLNDGIARTVDLLHKDKLDGHIFLFYLRDLITTHYLLLKTTKQYNVGVRTVLAGGERVQYSSSQTTGKSFLHYDKEKISEYGKSMLETTYVYNPSEFQMNTAFAKAFTIDNIGTKGNIRVNGFYIESTFLELIKDINNLGLEFTTESINIQLKNKLMFKLLVSENFEIDLKGIKVKIYHIGEFQILKDFDGDDIKVSLFR